MAKYSNTKAKINEKIITNGAQAVTGSILNDVLQTMVDSLGADYQFGGLVQPGSSFTAGEQPVVFLATTPGTYTNFGGLVVADGEVALLVWSGSAWSKQTPDISTRTELNQLGQYVDNPEWVEVVTDSQDKVLYGVKTDGKFYFGNGCPPQVVEHVSAQLEELGGDFTTLLNAKVDKVPGKSLIDANVAENTNYIDNPEWAEVTTDSDGNVLEGITTDGKRKIDIETFVGAPLHSKEQDIDGYIIRNIEDVEGRTEILTDKEGKIISYRDRDGRFVSCVKPSRQTIKTIRDIAPITVKEKIVGADNARHIPIDALSIEEASLIKFKGKTFLFYSQSDRIHEVIRGNYYNPRTNTFTGESWLVAGEDNMGIVADSYKCSFFIQVGEYLYGVVSIWVNNSDITQGNKVILIKSSDGVEWTLENNNMLDGVLPPEASSWWGNHCITYCEDDGYYYFFTERMGTDGWQIYVCKCQTINGEWEYVCRCEFPVDGVVGGPRAYYQDGKMKMVFHYTDIAGTAYPTKLGYAEANIEDLSNWTMYYRPLLDYRTRIVYSNQDQIADPELAEVDGITYLIATYVGNFNPFQASIWIWECTGRVMNILQSALNDLNV